jgi:hypothetical protein
MFPSPAIRSIPEKMPAIIASLRDLPIPLTMVSTYKGMTFAQEIIILYVLPGKVVLQAPADRILMGLSQSINLYSRALSETLTAQVQEVKEGRMVLSDLTATGRSWKERASERVQPRSPIYAEVHMNKTSIRATIEDLSITGMKLSAYKLFEKGLKLHSDAIGRIRFFLPDDPQEFYLKAQVVYFKSMGKMVKSGVRIFPSPPQTIRLQRYIASRKAEILQELDQKCAEIREPQKVCNLFF